MRVQVLSFLVGKMLMWFPIVPTPDVLLSLATPCNGGSSAHRVRNAYGIEEQNQRGAIA